MHEISVGELRNEEAFEQRLRDHADLRLWRRNGSVGRIVHGLNRTLEIQKFIEETIRSLTAALERLEDSAMLALHRAAVGPHEFTPVTDEAWTELQSRHDELTG